MNMRKIIAVLAAVLMLCTIIPMGAISVSAAPGDVVVNKNFDDGSYFTNGSNENGYMVFDATTADWANVYLYANNIKSGNLYEISFDCKANKAANINVKINNNWGGDTFKWTTNVTTEWATYTCVINPDELKQLTATALLMFTSNTTKANGAIYHIDNVVVKEYVDPSKPVYTEDFEGEHTWGGNNDAGIEVVPVSDIPVAHSKNGNFVAKQTVPANTYPYLSDRTGISVQPNTDYIVSVDVLNTSANWPVQLIIAENYWLGGAFATSLSQQIKPSTHAWDTYTMVFNTGDHNKIWLGAKSQWANTTIYFDNFSIAPYQGGASNDGYVLNGDFESGNLGWLASGNTEVIADPTGANKGNVLKTNELTSGVHMFSQPVQNLVVDKEYTLSFKVYGYGSASNTAFWVQFPSAFTTWSVETDMAHAKYNNYTPRINMNDKTGAWHYVNITFTAKAETAVIDFKNYRGDQGFYYFDDIKVSKAKDPSFDGYITNGDFETGKTTPWDKYSSTAVTAEAAKDGDYGMMLSGGGASYGGIANQNFTVVPGKTYTVRFDMKVVNAGVNVQIKDNDANVAGGYISKTEWTTYTYDFTPNYANANLNFCGSGIAGTDVAYLDNVMVYEKVEESDDGYIKNGTLDTGNSNRWSTVWSNQVGASVITGGKDSTFAAYIYGKDTQLWGQFRQSVAVEPNTDYKVTVWAKNSSGMSLLIKTGDDSANINNVGANAGEEWTLITNQFNSGNNTSVLVGIMVNSAGASGIFDTFVMEKLHTCNVVEQDRVDATCTTDGYVKYACDCGLGEYTEPIPAKGHTWDDATCTAPKTCSVCNATEGEALGHTYFNDCSAICDVCGYQREVSHNVIHVAAKATTCTAMGNIEYWYCDACGAAWLDAECTLNTNLRAVNLPMAEHVYFDDCSAICDVCGYQREVSHNVIHVEANAPTCTAMGNIEYWYCDACGAAWLDAECTLNTNLRAVNLPMAEHTYDNDFDADCNGCGATRVVAPVIKVQKSISEDVNGLAFKFDVEIAGLKIVEGRISMIDYTDATYQGYKLISMGAIASNGNSSVDIPATHLFALEGDVASVAYRVINIPAQHQGAEITMTPYFVVEIDGEATTIYGETVKGSYAEIAG